MSVPSQTSVLRGIAWMFLTGLLFVGVTASVKHMGDRVPAAEAAFLRYILGLVFLIPMLAPLRQARLGRRAKRLFWMRGLVHALGVMLWFYAMTRIPLAEITGMGYLAPVWVTLGAAFFLGERLAWPRLTAIAVALLGVMVILRPGFREVDIGHLAMLGTAILFAASYLIAKIMADEVSPTVVVAMLSITVPVGLAPFALAVWVWPTPTELAWLFVVAALATAGHLTMTKAFQAAPITVTQPVTFLQLVWATLLGLLVFGEPVDVWVMLGGTLILGSVVAITLREARANRRYRTPSVHETKT